jgi:hypothetical protein
LGKNTYGLATTGFNVSKEVFIDNSKLASSSKYGKSGLQKPHPNWSVIIKFTFRVLLGVPPLNKPTKTLTLSLIQLTGKQISSCKTTKKLQKGVDLELIILSVMGKDGSQTQF